MKRTLAELANEKESGANKKHRSDTVRHSLTQRGDSWVDCFRLPSHLVPTKEQFEALWQLHPAEYGEVKIMGKPVKTPRWQQSYGLEYRFSGLTHSAMPVPPQVQPYLDWANTLREYLAPFGKDTALNQSLVNWYQDGGHYIGFHSDDESQLAQSRRGESLVFSISLGQEREFVLRPRKGTQGETVRLAMPTGCVVVMGGRCQKTHKHAVPKVAGAKGQRLGRRINLTFRCFKQ